MFFKKFGSWNAAVKAAGLNVNKQNSGQIYDRTDLDQLIEQVIYVAIRLRKLPTVAEYNNFRKENTHLNLKSSALIRRYKRWSEILLIIDSEYSFS